MKISELAERKLIELAKTILEQDPDEILGLGLDDAAAKPVTEDLMLLLHTDVWVESADRLPGQTLRDSGWKAVTANVSDIAAKGGRPYGILVALGLPGELEKEEFEQLLRGFREACEAYKSYILGGDLSRASELVVAVSITGLASRSQILSRSGAEPGELVCLTGEVGYTSAAFKILLEGWEASSELRRKALSKVYRPKARLTEGLTLASTGVVSSCIDVSDGLAASLNLLSEASQVSILIDQIPIPEEVENLAEAYGENPLTLTLYEGGEEYELLFTVKPSGFNLVEEALSKTGCKITVLGRTGEGRGVYLKSGEGITKIEAGGWEHFKGWKTP